MVSFWVSSLATGGSYGTSGDQTYVYNKNLQENVSTYTLPLNSDTGGSVSGAGSFDHGRIPPLLPLQTLGTTLQDGPVREFPIQVLHPQQFP